VIVMVDIEVTRMSSRGQVVIPSDMREGFPAGEKIIVIRESNRIIMKRARDFDRNIEEDLEFARRTEAALKRYEKGECKEMSFDEFIDQAKKW